MDAGQTASLSGLTVANGKNLTVPGSSVGNGGGIADFGTLTVSNSAQSGNGASGDAGGAIFNAGTLSLTNCMVADNFAAVGGGIFNTTGGTATIQQNCTLSGNTAASGGGIDNGGTLTVRDSTLSGNSATGFDFGGLHFAGRGGGLDNLGTATIQESTLSGNTAGADGGGIANGTSGMLAIDDSVVCDNLALLGADLYNLGKVTLKDSAVCVTGP